MNRHAPPMSHERAWELLADHIDGEIDPAENEALLAHLRECRACAEELAAMQSFAEQAKSLPREREPEHDLWPGIRAAIRDQAEPAAARGSANNGQPQAERASHGWQRFFRLDRRITIGFALPACALLIWFLVGGIGHQQPQAPGSRGGMAGEVDSNEAILAALERESDAVDEEFARLADQGRSVSPQGGATADAAAEGGRAPAQAEMHTMPFTFFESQLRIVNSAIEEARSAWRANPDSPQLVRLLVAAYQAKSALRGRAAELADRT